MKKYLGYHFCLSLCYGFFFLVVLCGFFPQACFAASDILTAALKDGIGLRALSLGGAFTSLADDPSAVFYNPAGLAAQGIGFLKGYDDINFVDSTDFEHTFFAANSLGYGFWKKTSLSGERAEVFAYSAGRSGAGGVNYGLTFKNVNTTGASPESSGYSYDIGLMGSFSRYVRWGILFQDIIENINVAASSRVGLAVRVFPNLILVSDLEFRNLTAGTGPNLYFHGGLENVVTPGFRLRGGYDQNRWTAGAGINLSALTFEYALLTARSDGSAGALQMAGLKIGL